MEESKEITTVPSVDVSVDEPVRTLHTALIEKLQYIVAKLDMFLDDLNPRSDHNACEIDDETRLLCYDNTYYIISRLQPFSDLFPEIILHHRIKDHIQPIFMEMLMGCFTRIQKKGDKYLRKIFPLELVITFDDLIQLSDN